MGDTEPPLEDTEAGRASVRPRDEKGRPCLVAIAGAKLGEMHRLRPGTTIIGRGWEAGLRIDERAVSREHAKLTVERGTGNVTIEDLKSFNGTFVNGAAVSAPRQLQDADRVQIGLTVLKLMYADAMEETFQRRMHTAALRDPITGLFNRAYVNVRLENELAFALRHNTPLAVVMFEIDGFGDFAQNYDQEALDEALTQLVRRVQWTVRAEDVLARVGDEAFCVICRGVSTSGVAQLAERLRVNVRQKRFEVDGTTPQLTLSLGVCAVSETKITSPEGLIAGAEQALAEAKRQGGDRSLLASDLFDEEPQTSRGSQLPPVGPRSTR